MAEFTLETTYELKYDVKNKVPIDEVIESLKSVEHLLKRTPAFLELHYKGIRVVDSDVFVTSLESGSLKEKFWFKMLFKTDADAEKADELIEKVMRENDVVKMIIALGMGSVLTLGVMSALTKGSPSKHIEAYNNNIVNIGADVNFTADDVAVVLNGMKDKKTLAKNAVSALKPTQADPNARIEMNGVDELTIPLSTSKRHLKSTSLQSRRRFPKNMITLMLLFMRVTKITMKKVGLVSFHSLLRVALILF